MNNESPQWEVRWFDRGRDPRAPADPKFPKGVDLDLSNGAGNTCQQALPYPAKRVGFYIIECHTCDTRMMVTTAGRADDPRSVKIACKTPLRSRDPLPRRAPVSHRR